MIHRTQCTLISLAVLALVVAGCTGEAADRDETTSDEIALTPANTVRPTLCGGTVAAQLKDQRPGRLRLRDMENGEVTDVRLPPPPGGGKGPGTGWIGAEAHTELSTVIECADTDEGAVFVAYYYGEDYFYVAREHPKKAPLPTTLYGVTTEGSVAWKSDLPYVDPPVVRGGMVSVQHDAPDAVWPSDEPFSEHSGSYSVVDADDGEPVADHAKRLEYAVGLTEERIGYVRNSLHGLDYPELVDGDLDRIWRGRSVFGDPNEWYASDGVAVFVSEDELIGVDMRTGKRAWKLDRDDSDHVGKSVDRAAGVLIINGDVRGRQRPHGSGRRKRETISAIDLRTGTVLWRRAGGEDAERGTLGIDADGGVLALVTSEGDARLHDSRTGDRLRVTDGTTVRTLGPTHILVQRDGEFELIDRSSLRQE